MKKMSVYLTVVSSSSLYPNMLYNVLRHGTGWLSCYKAILMLVSIGDNFYLPASRNTSSFSIM